MSDHEKQVQEKVERAAETVRDNPALGAASPDPESDNSGTDDDATTPDGAVTGRD